MQIGILRCVAVCASAPAAAAAAVATSNNSSCSVVTVDYLSTLDRVYVVDGYAIWDPEVRDGVF